MAQVARELGIADTLRYRWLGEQPHDESGGQTRQSMRAGQDGLARFTRENQTLKQARD